VTIPSGTKLGRYEIRSKIGEGGMGEVYLAEDTRLARKVALKVLPAELASHRDRMQRFVQEAKAASALNHPNILTIYEIDETDSGHFIATEFIDGQTLREHIRQGNVKLSEILDVATQIASAFAAAHAAGIVHRDVKPDNIMLRRDGIVKVLDFGLAKLTEPTSADFVDTEAATRAAINTNPGVVMGTVVYMSPEQARGLQVDSRTDIFSIGVLIYQMIAGRLPFEGSNTNEILASILSEKEALPLARYAPKLPPELERIVEKALRKDREQRYQTIQDMLLDLKRLKQKLEVDAEIERSAAPRNTDTDGERPTASGQPTSSSEVATAPIAKEIRTSLTTVLRTHKLGVAFVSVAMVLAVAVGLYYFRFSFAASDNAKIKSIAVLPFENASGNSDVEYLSNGMTETLINSLSQLPNLSVKARSSVFRYKGKDVSPRIVGQELGVQGILMGRVVQHGDDLTLYLSLVNAANENQLWGKQYNQKLNNLVSLQTEIARDVSDNLKAKLTHADEQKLTKTYTANPEAYRLYLQGRYFWNKRTEKDISKSIDYFNRAVALDPNYALAYTGIADAYANLSMGFNFAPVRPELGLPKGKESALRALAIDDTLSEAHVSLGVVKERWDWDFAAAEREYKRAIELNPDYAEAHHRYSVFLSAMGRFDEAIAEIERARQLDPLSLVIAVDSARPFTLSGRYDHAVEILRKVLDMDPNFQRAHHLLAVNYSYVGRHEEAIAEIQKAYELVGGQFREDGTKRINDTLAVIFARAGRKSDALKILVEMDEPEQQRRYLYSYTRAAVYAELGDKEQALKWLEKAYGDRSPGMAELKVAHIFDKIRDNPRFADLIRRVGLPQ
jgi:serine/threonine protein kinase/TPR repeat protein